MLLGRRSTECQGKKFSSGTGFLQHLGKCIAKLKPDPHPDDAKASFGAKSIAKSTPPSLTLCFFGEYGLKGTSEGLSFHDKPIKKAGKAHGRKAPVPKAATQEDSIGPRAHFFLPPPRFADEMLKLAHTQRRLTRKRHRSEVENGGGSLGEKNGRERPMVRESVGC